MSRIPRMHWNAWAPRSSQCSFWGCAALHLKEDALRMAEAAIVRMNRIMLHPRKPEEELWLQLHRRTWNESKSAITTLWGCTPAVVVTACAALVVARLATRAACSIVGRALGWRSYADTQVMKQVGRGR